MAPRSRSFAAILARAALLFVRVAFGIIAIAGGYFGLTEAALGPGYGSAAAIVVADARPPAPRAPTLSIRDGQVTITGSVAGMFESASFIGPNEVGKTNRARLSVDVMSLTKTFALARERMTALHKDTEVALLDASKLHGDAVVAESTAVAEVAPTPAASPAAEPDLVQQPVDSAALNAIDKSVPNAPQPQTMPSQLAYARANAPVTTFPTPAKYSAKELWCMAEAIYFEARGEPYRGQVAVAQVVMNRVHLSLYPDTICGVVFQDENMHNACQFSFACDGIPETVNDPKAWAQAEDIAKKVTDGQLYLSEVGNATHYHAAYVYPDWAPRLQRVTRIGQHIFYRFKHLG
jgi:spore germination cell wall hydrolase CwlJ-like protein